MVETKHLMQRTLCSNIAGECITLALTIIQKYSLISVKMNPGVRNKKKYIVNLSTTILLIIQIICGFIVILLGEYFKNLLKRILSDVEHFEIFTIILFIELSGIYLITLYLCGIIIIKITKFSRYTTHLIGLLRLWLIVSVQAGTGSLIVALICNNTLHQLENTLEMTFVNSIKCYYSDANWKLIWDELQYNVQCCGVYGYTDWLNKTVLLDGTGIVLVKLNIAKTNPGFNLSSVLLQSRSTHSIPFCSVQLLQTGYNVQWGNDARSQHLYNQPDGLLRWDYGPDRHRYTSNNRHTCVCVRNRGKIMTICEFQFV